MKILHNYSNRIQRIQNLLKNKRLDGIYLAHVTSILYFTGVDVSVGNLLISPTNATLFVDSRYREYAENTTKLPIKNLDAISLQTTLSTWRNFAIEGSDMSYTEVLDMEKMAPSGASITSVTWSKELRCTKEMSEVTCMRESASLLWKGFLYVRSQLRVGITEQELDGIFRKFCIDHNASVAFDPIIAFGPNSSMPHHRSSSTTLQNNSLALIDIGLNIHSYASDMTRIVFFGDVDERWKHLHNVVEKAKQEALKLCRPGTIIRELDQAARSVFHRENVENHFVHSLGHGVGLDVHEWPSIHSVGAFADWPLKENMIITIEPGLYFPSEGGIRLEDTIQITASGYKNLFPKN